MDISEWILGAQACVSGTERVNKTMIQYVDIVKMNQLYILFEIFKLAVGFSLFAFMSL